MQIDDDPELLSLISACDMLAVSMQTLHKYRRRYHLAAYRAVIRRNRVYLAWDDVESLRRHIEARSRRGRRRSA